MQNEVVVQLHLDDIIPNRFQPREVFDDQALKELAVSIKEHGVIQPIIVRKIGEKYEIIAGERRYKASSLVGLTTIPAIVKNLDDKESSKVALIENLQRRDLTPIEEARTYQKILDIDDLTQEQLAKTMGKSQSSVANKLRLLTLPDEVQQALLKEQISERHARSLINLSDRNKQIELLNEIVTNRLPVREVDERIKKMNEESNMMNANMNINVAPSVEQVIESVPATMQPVDNQEAQFIRTAPQGFINPEPAVMNASLEPQFIDVAQTQEQTQVQTETFISAQPQIETLDTSPVVDQTVVDIDKIRMEATDINQTAMRQMADMSSLLKAEEPSVEETASQNRFIPDLEKPVEKTADGQEVIGTGLLAGMPVIHPVDNVAPMQQSGLSGIIEQENASMSPVQPLQMMQAPSVEPLPTVTSMPEPELMPTAEPMIEAAPVSEAPIQQATASSGQDFTDSEEIKFATIAMTNITKELESKGFKVEHSNNTNNGVMEIFIKISK